MKRLKKILLPAFLFLCISLQAQHFDSLLTKLNTQYPQEKLYLQFDRPVYSPGETIWFKAYLFADNFPSQISKTLYAELVDVKGKVIEQVTAPFAFSGAAASLNIPANINSSAVYVRAYTSWMLNFDSSFIYTKAIPLTKISSKKMPAVMPSFFLQFFPEGGDLVQNVPCRVAFKATNATGLPINITGNIVNSREQKIISFSSVHDGMGTFLLQAENTEQYKAVWQDPSGKKHETLLPVAKATGVALEVNNKINTIEFKIKRSQNAAAPFAYVYVVAQLNQQLLYRAKAKLDKTSVSGIIPIENVGPGIIQITLFTPDEQPIAERLVFANQGNYSFITDVNSALTDMGKRKKNVIQVDVPDTLLCNLSVAVTDADLTAVNTTDNIFSHVLLTSDIHGYVHNPAYYFSGDADSVVNNLDLVMMTNGWRRFKWENILAGKWPKIKYLPDNYLSIEGKILGLSEQQLANRELNFIIELKNGNKQFENTKVLPDGRFIIPDLIIYDTAKVFYQFNNDKNKSLTSRASFVIKNNLLHDVLHLKPDSTLLVNIDKADTLLLKKNAEIYRQLTQEEIQKVKVLQDVVITGRQKSKEEIADEEYTSGFFSGGDSRTFLPENDPALAVSQSVFNYLNGRVAGLQISTSGGEASATWRGGNTSYFLNEMPQDAATLMNIPMSDVAMIKVFKPPFFGAIGGGSGGAIAVYLKKGKELHDPFFKGLDYANFPGYTPAKEFYSPDYSKITQPANADYRTTLYWNPFLITGKNNRRLFLTFYNNDITKKIKVIIEGCNENGQLTRVEKIL